MNIFLVEDSDLDVEILNRSLKKLDMQGMLVRAKDGVEALEILNGDFSRRDLPRPFVILLDINMPRMNGHEFLATIRQDPKFKRENVFVFSTSENPNDIALAYQNNANGYIVKPDSSSRLNEIILSLKRFWDICEHPVAEFG